MTTCPMFDSHTEVIELGRLGDYMWYRCRHCGWEWKVSYDDDGIEDCPVCGESCKDDVTIADHGMCYDCHQAFLMGELCNVCLEPTPCDDHDDYDDYDWREEALTDAERNPGLVSYHGGNYEYY